MISGKIYKIISDETPKVYIGSTVKKYLSSRMAEHRSNLNLEKSISSSEITVYKDARIVLIEEYKCENKFQLTAREQYWIDNTENVVNKHKAHTGIVAATKKEYIDIYYKIYKVEKKDELAERRRNKYLLNKDTLTARNKCLCGGKFTTVNRYNHYNTKIHLDYFENKNSSIN